MKYRTVLSKNSLSQSVRRFRRGIVDRVSTIQLTLTKHAQKSTFYKFSGKCSEYYRNLMGEDVSQFMTSVWREKNRLMEKLVLHRPPFSFLRDPEIRATMFLSDEGSFFRGQLGFCEKAFASRRLKELLEEDYVGKPIIRHYRYLTSHNRVNHLYHLLKFQAGTGVYLQDLTEVVEWGGGYGNMARLMLRINPDVVYTIVDTPLFSCIQWIYLVSILGAERVNLVLKREDKVDRGKITLLPVCFLEWHELTADVFIGTWSLSESSKYAIDYVTSHHFFNARHLLLGYRNDSQLLPYSRSVGILARGHGASIEPFEFCPGNYYAFR